MLRIHVCLDLEHEAGELVLGGRDLALHGRRAAAVPARAREMRQQFLDAEVGDGGAEEHGRLTPAR